MLFYINLKAKINKETNMRDTSQNRPHKNKMILFDIYITQVLFISINVTLLKNRFSFIYSISQEFVQNNSIKII